VVPLTFGSILLSTGPSWPHQRTAARPYLPPRAAGAAATVGVTSIDGRMIDFPLIRQAERVLVL
jgi:hypothetical protein